MTEPRVERVARAIERAFSRNHASVRSDPDIAWKVWTPEAEAAIEASRHAELVEALKKLRHHPKIAGCRPLAPSELRACFDEIDALLAKLGGSA